MDSIAIRLPGCEFISTACSYVAVFVISLFGALDLFRVDWNAGAGPYVRSAKCRTNVGNWLLYV